MDKKPVIILGAGSLGKAVLDIFNSNGIVTYCFLDDNKKLHSTEIDTISVLGSTSDDGFLKYIGKKCDAFVASDDNAVRKSTVKMLHDRRKVQPMNAVHNKAFITDSAKIGYGNFINAGAIIGSAANVGSHCLIHSNALVDYDVSIGDFVQVGAGSVINAGVEIEDEVFIGSGVIIVSGVKVAKGARIGAGSVVISDVQKKQTVFGNPAVALEK